ncbi:SAM-dependent methyltransferase [Ottowia thiooxydans]|uniref:SAM-dependent methyltransferase n=1 Tax=Ottowia thiooxydans TaxID=219182 RepID=UPI0003FF8D60|nr:cyclopropane-fatty-acyl-phospholipid synthase family protein [Ottowia thiooxydans]
MRLSLDSSNLESALSPWAKRLRRHIDLPLLVRWHGSQGVRLGEFDTPRVTIDLKDATGVAALLTPSLDNLGRAYVEGHIDVTGSVQDVIDIAHGLAENGHHESHAGLLQRLFHRIVDAASHTRDQDREAIQYHYDVSNEFYAEWLDPAMVYSCAYFETGTETLAEAQRKKIDHILTKLRIEPGQTLLDIGCGWGALVLRAAEKFGARCVGITLSENQHRLACERVRAAGLQNQIEIRLQDYRDVKGSFDRISSVGMFEHVGLKNLPSYFRIIHDLLAPDGWALNHGITSTDPKNGETSHGGGRFIDRYVFPQGELPHIGTVLATMQQGGLEAIDAENLRRHYARTLECWSEAFEAKGQHLKSLVDEKHWRIWRMYLVGSQWAFENDEIALFQVLCRRKGQNAKSLPWSRGWMYGA